MTEFEDALRRRLSAAYDEVVAAKLENNSEAIGRLCYGTIPSLEKMIKEERERVLGEGPPPRPEPSKPFRMG